MEQRFYLHVKVNKLQNNTGIWLPILYHELNKNDTILVQGWVKDSETVGTWHVWCETAAGKRIDPQVILLNIGDTGIEYTIDKPEEVHEDENIVKQWELYEKSPQDFWKTQTPDIKSFRSKIFSLVRKNKL